MLSLVPGDETAQQEKERQVSTELKEFLLSAGFDGIEIARAQDQRHYRWVSTVSGEERAIPVTLTFDAHCIEDMGKTDRITWVKMTKLGFSGLCDALKFPETRVRFPGDLPTPPSPRLLGVEIIGTKGKSFFEQMLVGFSENLNCLIGPRGSGKSTLVEALRYVFGYNRTLHELDAANRLSSSILELQRANLSDSLIRIVYKTNGEEIRVLEATFDPKSNYGTKVFSENGDHIDVPDVETAGDYPLRLFGWSEIETLGRDPARQRDLLDRLVGELPPLTRERTEYRGRLQENRKEIDRILTELSNILVKNNGEIRRYTEYKNDFDKLNTDQVRGLFSSLDRAQRKRRLLKQVLSNADELQKRLGEPDTLTLRKDLDRLLQEGDQALRDWWLGEEIARLGILATEEGVRGALRQAIETLATFCQLVQEHTRGVNEEIAALENTLRADFAADASMQKLADLRANAEQRLRRASVLRDEYSAGWQRLQASLSSRRAVSDCLAALQDQITGIRARYNQEIEETLNRFLSADMKVSIKFQPGGDTRLFCEKAAQVLSGIARYKARKLPELVAARYNPVTFVRAFLDDQIDGLAGTQTNLDGEAVELTTADVTKVKEQWKPFGWDEHAQVSVALDDGKRLRSLLALEEVEWDDHEAILLNNRPVNELSPGQRSSAMLPLIALAETTPLVIDQPEDNLDNRLVGRVLVNILAELKEKRQIIVCTHNPNIVVSGDAEQVIVLDAISDREGRVSQHGSIDNDDIVRTVVEIMEGGKEAFMARHRRYGF
jgi:energy-coupling factor transporter ATP-binding protein EcfA2